MILPEDEYKLIIEKMPVVCVDGLIINEKGEYLLVKRKHEPLKNEFWLPGGRLFKNEKLHDAIKRIIKEEIGIKFEVIKNVGYFEDFFEKTYQEVDGGFHAISFIFLLKPLSLDVKLDKQSEDWGWFKDLPKRFKAYKTVDQVFLHNF